MAAAKPSQELGKETNYVAQDCIWRAHIETEMATSKRWPDNWGFLTTPPAELLKNETEEKKERPCLGTPELMRIHPVTPLEKHIQVAPSPPVPRTTQGFVGWRSSVPELQLDRYGKSSYPQGDFCKEMKWPTEALD
ncbi:hypothetical protein XENTR_v10003503 [Xenopus tropicalis]|uniref:Chromosome 20 open reading frame 85 n=1 Tax=Xenopus tropicalis TaxID=8364 RepID=A0A803JUY6_XENTR|nr:uncharacterized protein C20orf85 homolog isoform X1 [Xenopus tropicalis]KAE8574611.1 hypothetical protein XENTR_v10003503 [Xenopus tropicalis]